MLDIHVPANLVEAVDHLTDGDVAEHAYAVILREPTGYLEHPDRPARF